MRLQMSSNKFDADQKLLDFIQKKADKLDTFYDRIIDGEVHLSLDKSEQKANKVVEMKVQVPGSTLFASQQSKSFEEATDLTIEALRRQLRKYKGKQVQR